jgi:hypothetical protein
MEETWNILHILSLTILEDVKKEDAHSFVFKLKEFLDQVLLYFKKVIPTESIMECTDSNQLFRWMYECRKNITSSPPFKELLSYYQPMNKKESSLLTKDVWGAYIWKWMHRISLTSNSNLSLLFSSLFNILPCEKCKTHALEYCNQFPIPSQNVFEWTIQFHNEVSKQTNAEYGKRKRSYTVEESRIRYEN